MFPFLKKFWIPLVTIALAFGLTVAKNFQSADPHKHETLIVGLQSGYPPFEFMDLNGTIVGFDVDLAKRIAKKLEKTLVIKDMEFEGQILSLKQGKIDLIMSGMNITPSRVQEITMIPYHGEAPASLSLIFWKEIPLGVQTLEDLSKLPNPAISVESGSIPEEFLSRVKNIPAKSFQGALAPLLDVKFGKSIANLVEGDVAKYLKKQHPEIQVLTIPLPKEEGISGFGIGVKKENQPLAQQVQQIIDELKISGELQQLEDHWFKGVEHVE